MELSRSKEGEKEEETNGLLVLGGYNMDYVTEVRPSCDSIMSTSSFHILPKMVQVEMFGNCKGLPPMEGMVEGRTRSVAGEIFIKIMIIVLLCVKYFEQVKKSKKNTKNTVLSYLYCVLSQIYALWGVKFLSFKICRCKINDKC